ncbi:hypothetical protein LTR36_004791 [Oleoguttula mirabilis]|uniref:Vacuolar membrane PQ loop repeat protein n=1 Tax=Oleoguttula mirabilis TaxID=1507867 RepID=A0AAV9JFF6_9PEZI|nr:hypothetical protein LTR36_004791 [Oleoguttula mirabilis]
MLAHALPLTWNEALSGITGSISLAAWIFLLLPQLWENFRNGNADGLSLAFLLAWFVGDITNLAGAVWAGLVPTVVALAVYFCAADTVLIAQVFYYRWANSKKADVEEEAEAGKADGHVASREETPLLQDGQPTSPTVTARRTKRQSFTSEDNSNLPGSRRRSSAASSSKARQRNASSGSLEAIVEEPTNTRAGLKNTAAVLAILLAGTAGWAIAYKTGAWRPTPLSSKVPEAGGDATPVGAMVLGYFSAVCYLGARIPQIAKNQRERSCDGLSLLFFMLSLLGNATYGMGILFHSVERQYFLTNLPWLIGSLGTMAEDAVIFLQFHYFGEKRPQGDEAVDGEAVE